MTERGMIFNAEMVRAILDGRKTQTRRIAKLSHERSMKNPVVRGKNGEASYVGCRLAAMLCPFGQPGDRIWVREAWTHESIDAENGSYSPDYRATANGQPLDGRWRPSIHMPRWASRITLEITDVRVERLNSISEEDAKAEGAPTECCVIGDKHFLGFRSLWKSIYGDDSWQANPWVWVIEFRRVDGEAV